MNHFVYVRDLVGVRTNAESFRWSFGSAAPAVSEEQFSRCRIKIDLRIVKDRDVPLPPPLTAGEGNFRFFHGYRNAGTLAYHRKLFGLPLSYTVSVRGNVIRATVGKTYFRLIRLKVMNLHPIWYVLFDLTTALLLKNGYLPVYASSFAHDERGALVMAPPNTGKTLTAIRLSENPRVRLLGEDIAVTDGERIYAVPWTDTYRSYGAAADTGRHPAFSETSAPLDRLFLLERGSGGLRDASSDCEKRIALLNRYGIGWSFSPAVTALGYFNDDVSPESLREQETAILRAMTGRAEILTVAAEDAAQFATLILSRLEPKEHDINCPAALI